MLLFSAPLQSVVVKLSAQYLTRARPHFLHLCLLKEENMELSLGRGLLWKPIDLNHPLIGIYKRGCFSMGSSCDIPNVARKSIPSSPSTSSEPTSCFSTPFILLSFLLANTCSPRSEMTRIPNVLKGCTYESLRGSSCCIHQVPCSYLHK